MAGNAWNICCYDKHFARCIFVYKVFGKEINRNTKSGMHMHSAFYSFFPFISLDFDFIVFAYSVGDISVCTLNCFEK